MQLLIKPTDISEYKISHDLSSSTQSDSAIAFLLEKYHDCREKHAKCNLKKSLDPVTYPSRLLDVMSKEHNSVILRSTSMVRDVEYVCLSHCWGDMTPFTLNAKTQSTLRKGITIETLPKTFQDAIVVTRRLGLQYLWIDSLYVTTYPLTLNP
jgi:hypothetical protein